MLKLVVLCQIILKTVIRIQQQKGFKRIKGHKQLQVLVLIEHTQDFTIYRSVSGDMRARLSVAVLALTLPVDLTRISLRSKSGSSAKFSSCLQIRISSLSKMGLLPSAFLWIIWNLDESNTLWGDKMGWDFLNHNFNINCFECLCHLARNKQYILNTSRIMIMNLPYTLHCKEFLRIFIVLKRLTLFKHV